ncbi:hypothetical protein J6590_061213 [Homalodisca vitripennis]|nr:hypothetical protein J6590_061213 [Homalodisca vitripennis]
MFRKKNSKLTHKRSYSIKTNQTIPQTKPGTRLSHTTNDRTQTETDAVLRSAQLLQTRRLLRSVANLSCPARRTVANTTVRHRPVNLAEGLELDGCDRLIRANSSVTTVCYICPEMPVRHINVCINRLVLVQMHLFIVTITINYYSLL